MARTAHGPSGAEGFAETLVWRCIAAARNRNRVARTNPDAAPLLAAAFGHRIPSNPTSVPARAQVRKLVARRVTELRNRVATRVVGINGINGGHRLLRHTRSNH